MVKNSTCVSRTVNATGPIQLWVQPAVHKQTMMHKCLETVWVDNHMLSQKTNRASYWVLSWAGSCVGVWEWEEGERWGTAGVWEGLSGFFRKVTNQRFLNLAFFSDSLSGVEVCERRERVNWAVQLFIEALAKSMAYVESDRLTELSESMLRLLQLAQVHPVTLHPPQPALG